MSNNFENCLKDIIKFNDIAGKIKESYSEDDFSDQWGRLIEEADHEFYGTILKINKEGLTYDNKIQLVDDVVDIIFVNSFLEYMHGGLDNITRPHHMNTVDSLELGDENIHSLISLAYSLYSSTSFGVNFERGLRLVCANNLTKFPKYDVDIMSKTFDMYNETVLCHNYHDENTNETLMVFKRLSDNKVMKPHGYEPVDLSLSVEFKGEPV